MTLVKFIREQSEYLKKLSPDTQEYKRVKEEINQANIKLVMLSLNPNIDLKSA